MHELAFNLGLTVSDMEEKLFNEELQDWLLYFEQRPMGWRDDLRTFYLMSSFGEMKKSPQEIFPSLRPIMKAESDAASKLTASDTLNV